MGTKEGGKDAEPTNSESPGKGRGKKDTCVVSFYSI